MSASRPLQAQLQVDLDFSTIRQKAQQADQIADQADRKADQVRRKAREVARELEQQEALQRRIESRVVDKVIQDPLKKIGRIGIAMAASEWAGPEGGTDGENFLRRAGSAALMGLAAGGPQGAAISVVGASLNFLIDAWRDAEKELKEIRKRLNAEREERKLEAFRLQEEVRKLQLEAEEQKHQNELKIRRQVHELEERTWRLMTG